MCSLQIESGVLLYFSQKTADEMRISGWSSDVCSSDLAALPRRRRHRRPAGDPHLPEPSNSPPPAATPLAARPPRTSTELGSASCRDRVCQYVSISVVAVSLQK